MGETLDRLAERYHIALGYHELDGSYRTVSEATKIALLEAFGVTADTQEAQSLSLERAPPAEELELRAPSGLSCYEPAILKSRSVWGVALQVYQLRSTRNWGIGDFADLRVAVQLSAAAGAAFVGTNPLHALFPAEPERVSPFFPSNRQFLNPLYIAVDLVPGYKPNMADGPGIEKAREGDLVDYAHVTELKYAALRRVWTAYRAKGDLSADYSHDAFRIWRERAGQNLEKHALFDAIALSRAGGSSGETGGWHAWPEEWHDAQGDTVEAFARENADDVSFHAWLQFIADRQLGEAAETARDAGMAIGLYLDLAVGEAPDGSATWTEPAVAVVGAELGAPPDYFTKAGQNWGLAGLSPAELVARDFGPYRDLMEAVMRHAGAIRVDHAMGVWQLFFIPRGRPAAEGTYVRFPIGEMLGVIAKASEQNEAVVVGEDLGNVPDGFREVMDATNLQSYRILYFERDEDGFRPPDAYPVRSLACLSTHDLPTIEGWWRADDVALRHEFGLIDGEAAEEQNAMRERERRELAGDLARTGLLTREEADAVLARTADDQSALPTGFVAAVHRHLACTASRMAAVRIEDLAGERKPVNLPGTVAEYPNWRRRLGMSLEDLAASDLFAALTEAMRAERPHDK
ncbi:4-alpha-glucanotransferase [Pararhizobium mangrovi]|nr:4-alpha-glucanotransferase [Pararhizobium mangrovi]